MNKCIVRYVRFNEVFTDYLEFPEVGRRPIGVVVAVCGPDGPVIGWSKCSPKDRFNRKRGTEIAIGRTVKDTQDISSLPNEYQEAFSKAIVQMNSRAQKYFK
jgi:hypothetical protein